MSTTFKIIMAILVAIVALPFVLDWHNPETRAANAGDAALNDNLSISISSEDLKEAGNLLQVFERQCPKLVSQWADDVEGKKARATMGDAFDYMKEREWGDRYLNIELTLKRDGNKIPSHYRAHGHTCNYRIDSNGTAIATGKDQCASLCNITRDKGQFYKQLKQPKPQPVVDRGFPGYDSLYIRRTMRDALSIPYQAWEYDSEEQRDFAKVGNIVFSSKVAKASVAASPTNSEQATLSMLACLHLGNAGLKPETENDREKISQAISDAVERQKERTLNSNGVDFSVHTTMNLLFCSVEENHASLPKTDIKW